MRYRFIDRVVSFEEGDVEGPTLSPSEKGKRPRLITEKAFPPSDDYTEGHPLRPGEVPHCLVLETLATSGVYLVYSHTAGKVVGVLLRVEEAKILSRVSVGEELVVHTELLGFHSEAYTFVGLARTKGRAVVQNRVVAEARLVLLCFPRHGFEASLPW